MGDDAGARAGQDSRRGVREPRTFSRAGLVSQNIFHFSLQSVYDMSFKRCNNATEALRVSQVITIDRRPVQAARRGRGTRWYPRTRSCSSAPRVFPPFVSL